MSTLITASICLTDLVDKAKAGHSAFVRGKNGKVYVNITEWINDEPDQFGNHASFILNSTQEKRDSEGKVYVGNGKVKSVGGDSKPAEVKKDELDIEDGLPF